MPNMRLKSLEWARELLLPGIKNWMILDTETTALDSDGEVIEVAAIDSDGEPLVNTLVKCQGFITPGAQAVHGITMEDLKHAPTFPEVWAQLEALMTTRPNVIVYNAAFDSRMLMQSRVRHTLPTVPNLAKTVQWHCLMNRYAWVYGDIGMHGRPKWQSLGNAIKQQRIQEDWQWHRALGDCRASLALLKKMAERAEVELAQEVSRNG